MQFTLEQRRELHREFLKAILSGYVSTEEAQTETWEELVASAVQGAEEAVTQFCARWETPTE